MSAAPPTVNRPSTRAGYGFALGSGVGWGVANVLNGIALAMSPFAFAERWLLAPLVAATVYEGLRASWQLVFVGAARRWGDLTPLVRGGRGTVPTVLAALAGGPWATGFFFLSLALAGVTFGVTISATAPAFGAVWGALLLRETMGARVWMGVVLSVGGAALVAYRPPEGAPPHFYLGVLCAVLCALGWSFEAVFAKRAMAHLTPVAVATVRQVLSFAVLVAVLLPALGGAGFFVEALRSSSTLVILVAAFTGSIAYQLYFVSVHRVGVSRAMPLNISYVLWTAVLGALFLGEPPTWRLAVGAVAIMSGAWLVVSGEPRPQEEVLSCGPAPVELPEGKVGEGRDDGPGGVGSA